MELATTTPDAASGKVTDSPQETAGFTQAKKKSKKKKKEEDIYTAGCYGSSYTFLNSYLTGHPTTTNGKTKHAINGRPATNTGDKLTTARAYLYSWQYSS